MNIVDRASPMFRLSKPVMLMPSHESGEHLSTGGLYRLHSWSTHVHDILISSQLNTKTVIILPC